MRRGVSTPAAPQRAAAEAPRSNPPRLMLNDIDDSVEERLARDVNEASGSHESPIAEGTMAGAGRSTRFDEPDHSSDDDEGEEEELKMVRHKSFSEGVKKKFSHVGAAVRALSRKMSRSSTSFSLFSTDDNADQKRAYLKGTRSFTRNWAVEKAREPERKIPMPEVPSGFRNIGEYVDHCRWVQEKERQMREGLTDIREDEVLDVGDPPPPLRLAAITDGSDPPPHEPEPADTSWPSREAATELRIAARDNDAPRIRILLFPPDEKKGVPVDCLDAKGETAAVVAARAGCAASCAALLDGGANPLMRDLHVNCFGDAVWPDERTPDTFGRIPEKCSPCMETGRTVVYNLRLRGLLEQVLRSVFPLTRLRLVCSIADGIQKFHKRCPLLVAAKEGYLDLMGLLLAHIKALPHKQVSDPETPRSQDFLTFDPGEHWKPSHNACGRALLEAASYGNWRCAEILIASRIPRIILNEQRDKKGCTVLHISAAAGKSKLVEQLLHSGASWHVFSHTGLQALHYACSAGHRFVVELLLEWSADPNVVSWKLQYWRTRRNKNSGKTPFQIAFDHGHRDVVEALTKVMGSDDGVSETDSIVSVPSGTPAARPLGRPSSQPIHAWSNAAPRGKQARPATR